MRAAQSLLRLWLLGTALLVAILLIWAFAPVLVFVALLAAGLGVLSFAMIGLARALERGLGRWRRRSDSGSG